MEIWILAITILRVLKFAITTHLIGNLPLQLRVSLVFAIFYVSHQLGPIVRLVHVRDQSTKARRSSA